MSKGLEALQDIRLRVFIESEVQSKKVIKDLKTIEKELKEYESYRGFLDNDEKGIIIYTPRDIWEEERKKLKALEIIVKKANIRLWHQSNRFYFKTTNNLYEISKEKYDLLKEVFKK